MAICGMLPNLIAWGCIAGFMIKNKESIDGLYEEPYSPEYDFFLETPLTACVCLYSFVTLYPLVLTLFWRPVGACMPKMFVCWMRFSNLLMSLANVTLMVFASMGLHQIYRPEGAY